MGGRRIAFGACLSAALLVSAGTAHADAPVTAVLDHVHTTVNTPVDFDPAANDTIGSGFTFSFNEIESQPQHGTATVNPDNKTIHYVPDKDYTGPDTMEYNVHVCQQLDVAAAVQSCTEDTGDIDITVDPAPATTTTSTVTIAPLGTTAPAASTTTVAAAAAQLPRTGSTNGPLFGLGIVAVAGGAVLTASMRRRATR